MTDKIVQVGRAMGKTYALSKNKYSDCCDALMYEDVDRCSKCKEPSTGYYDDS